MHRTIEAKRKSVGIRTYEGKDRKAITQLLDELQDLIASVDSFGTEDRKTGFGRASLMELIRGASKNNGVIYVAETKDKKKIVGMVTAFVLQKDELSRLGSKSGIRTGEIHSLYVRPSHRGEKVGKELMIQAESYLKEQNCTNIELGVFWPNVNARKFYEHSGYEPYNVTYIKRVK
jgi:ribosomal protein S18 acetylase RimI-like enzyme